MNDIELNTLKENQRIRFRSKFNTFINQETANDYIIQSTGTYDLTETEIDYDYFIENRESWGFKQVDRSVWEKSISKFSLELEGNHLKIVKYKNWMIRVIKETNEKYFIIGSGTDIRSKFELKMIILPNGLHGKWVPKAECEEIDIEAERKKLGM